MITAACQMVSRTLLISYWFIFILSLDLPDQAVANTNLQVLPHGFDFVWLHIILVRLARARESHIACARPAKVRKKGLW